ARLRERESKAHRDEVVAPRDFWIELSRFGANLWSLDVVLFDFAVIFAVHVPVIAAARREQKVHHVQTETKVACTRLLIEQSLPPGAADIAACVDPHGKLVGVDQQMIVRALDANRSFICRYFRDAQNQADK